MLPRILMLLDKLLPHHSLEWMRKLLPQDMRDKPGANLLDALLQAANTTEEGQDLKTVFLPALSAISAALAAFERFGPAAVPISNSVRDVFVPLVADKREKVRSALDEFLQMVGKKSKIPAIVVDEANLALPGLTNGQDSGERREAKSALAAITKWTKQDKLSSVVLISSEFAYPFRLQAAGLDLRDIGKVIVIGEVPESDMLKMLKDDWGMDEDVAEVFYNYFGGDIYTTKQAVESLIRKRGDFDPFAVVRCPGLPSCVKNAVARAHLENIAKQGFSLVEDVETDEGARMIAEKNVGGVIDKGAITFGLPTIHWHDETWAVIPSSYHMKLLIAQELQNISLPTGPCFTNRFFCFFVVLFSDTVPKKEVYRSVSRLNNLVELYI